MDRVCTVFFYVLLISTLDGGFTIQEDNYEDNLHYVKTIINDINYKLKEKKMDNVGIRREVMEFFIGFLEIKEGLIGNFSSIVLRNVPQEFKKTQTDGATLYDFDLTLGLEELILYVDFNLDVGLFYRAAGKIRASTDEDSVRIKGSITINGEEPGTCVANMNSAVILNVGKFKISVTPQNTLNDILNFIAEMGINQLSSFALPHINFLIDQFINDDYFQTFFKDLVCSFVKPEY